MQQQGGALSIRRSACRRPLRAQVRGSRQGHVSRKLSAGPCSIDVAWRRRRPEPACGDASVGGPARPYPAEAPEHRTSLSIASTSIPHPLPAGELRWSSSALVESTPRACAEHSCIILHHSSVVTSRCSSPTPQVQCRRARMSVGARWPSATASGIAAAH
ncbi:hypothetical protein FA09DRAFT_62446 [Tilletiopsis washingtonensis]|uniref:Uncharacterized protein n=1 Tax=Tilletiopsis washingtonensis TaxID=58919 RepID=A0A316ZA66_9BASI|nr:hypothetical protein FA09DRAFT_62446 [Tilletiopsis washingtonensis]PWN97155.1 hypothetical protein FA09DRAFT_62446 [Tilletiopsis washingtonensis]